MGLVAIGMTYDVYSITCRANSRAYIGQSSNAYNRLCGHKAKLLNGSHVNPRPLKDYQKFGESEFEFRIEQSHMPREAALLAEADLIMKLGMRIGTYNGRLDYIAVDDPTQCQRFPEEARKRLGSVSAVARHTGINRATLKRIRRGDTIAPHTETLAKLMRALHV